VATAIGKIDIIWKTNMGERGRLQTSQLPRKVPHYGEIEVDVVWTPEILHVEEPFELVVRVTNHSNNTMSLRLFYVKSKMAYISFVGSSAMLIGELLPGQEKTVRLKLFPLAPGLQKIGGIGLNDSISGKVFDIENLTEVFVNRE